MAKTTKPEAILAEISSFMESKTAEIGKAIDDLLDQQKGIKKQIDELNEAHHRATGKWYIAPKTDGKAEGGRQKRTKAELNGVAKKAFEWLKSQGKKGASASEFGSAGHGDMKPNPMDFIKKYVPDAKIEKTGSKVDRKYFA